MRNEELNKNLFIRTVEEKDAEELHDLLKHLDKKMKVFFHPHGFDYETIKKICLSKNDHYFVMILDNRIIGYSFLRLFGYETPSFGIVIRNGLTGKGYGMHLTRWTINKARELGYKKVILKTYKENIPAQVIYQKIGFRIVGETEDKKQYKMEIEFKKNFNIK
jgi:RimJ/RimL family protein N-acetyltransferase